MDIVKERFGCLCAMPVLPLRTPWYDCISRQYIQRDAMHYNARMSRATPSISLRAVLLLLIVLLQLLSPLLHGHFGTPKQTGLHVHTALSGAVDSHFQSLGYSYHRTSSHEGGGLARELVLTSKEPFEVDVESAISPTDLAAFLAVAAGPGLSALTFLLLAALACSAISSPVFRPAPIRARWHDRFNRPPPAQAPPLACRFSAGGRHARHGVAEHLIR